MDHPSAKGRPLARLLREPLLHFMAIGACIFGLQAFVGSQEPAPPPPTGPSRSIVVSTAYIEGLAEEQLSRTGKRPTAEQLRALAEAYADEEVLFREALALGLDRGDPIIRRRLVQKMQFTSQDIAPVEEPKDADLQRYLDEHQDALRRPARVRLTHVFFSRDRRGDATRKDAEAALAELAALPNAETRGDAFLLGSALPLRSESELAGIFGPKLAAAVIGLQPGGFAGPFESSYGLHLVRVLERKDARPATLAEVRNQIYRRVTEDRRAAANRAATAELRKKYDITIEPLPDDAASGGATASVRPGAVP